MKINHYLFSLAALALCVTGCSTSKEAAGTPASAAPGSRYPAWYKSTDGRQVNIGNSSAADNGWAFKEPHMNKCWIADGFNFTGYDVVYIAPTLSTAKFNPDEVNPHELAKQNLVIELNRDLSSRGLFPKVVTSESDISTNAHVLKMENTIVEYKKGGGAARYWVGMYGGGQPVLRIQGKMTDGDKIVFAYELRRSGVSAGAHTIGAFMRDEDIQLEDIRSLTLDLGDFMSAIAGKYPVLK